MSTNEHIVIKDACILFDLIDLELLDDFFKLDVKAITTSFVVAEITDPVQEHLILEKIASKLLLEDGNGDLLAIMQLNADHPGLSIADCSILELSSRQPGLILSSDKSLRNEAKRRNLTVKGVLWVINQLFEKGHLSKEVCLAKLELYPRINKRTPKSDIEKLISKLNQL